MLLYAAAVVIVIAEVVLLDCGLNAIRVPTRLYSIVNPYSLVEAAAKRVRPRLFRAQQVIYYFDKE